MLSPVWLFAAPWTVARQAPLSMGFSRQEYWSRLPGRPPEDLPNPGIKPRSTALQADSLSAELQGKSKNIGVGTLFLLQVNFWPRNWTGVSCFAGRFFISWATREAPVGRYLLLPIPSWVRLGALGMWCITLHSCHRHVLRPPCLQALYSQHRDKQVSVPLYTASVILKTLCLSTQ